MSAEDIWPYVWFAALGATLFGGWCLVWGRDEIETQAKRLVRQVEDYVAFPDLRARADDLSEVRELLDRVDDLLCEVEDLHERIDEVLSRYDRP